jgi:hypothetical protein
VNILSIPIKQEQVISFIWYKPNLWKDFNGSIGVIYSKNNFSQSEITESYVDNKIEPFARVTSTEEITKIDFPLTFSYRFGRGNLNYSARIGGMVSFITDVSLTPVRSQEGMDDISANIAIDDNRQKYYYSLVAGTGLEYKVPRGFIVLDIRYNYGMQNFVNTKNRFSSQRYLYTDDDFMLNALTVSIGYHFRIYQSKKNRY